MNQIMFHEGLIACDRLDNVELAAGENVRVRFPDGTEEDHEVLVNTEYFDHAEGFKLEVMRRRAFFNVSVHGQWKWVTAVGLFAKRV